MRRPISWLLVPPLVALAAASACVDASTPSDETPSAASLATAARALEPDPQEVAADDEACEDEPTPPMPLSHAVCFSLQRGWAGTVSDATAGPRAEDKARLTVASGERPSQVALAFDTARLPRDVRVVSATLRLTGRGEGEARVEVRPILGRWVEDEVGPETRLELATEPIATLNGRGTMTAELAPLVQDWIAGRADNLGVALRATSGEASFASSEADLRFERPSLDVCVEPLRWNVDPPGPKGDFGVETCEAASVLKNFQLCEPDAFHTTAFCTNTWIDENNCGGCGVSCGSDEICHFGACLDSTKATEVCAEDGKEVCQWPKTGQATCEDLASDHDNCGACANVCLPTEQCAAGKCTCGAAPSALCDGVCVNASSNNDHCGACGQACAEGSMCLRGVCVAPGDSALIGDDNARYFSLDGQGGLELERSAAYQKKWTHVASTVASNGVPLLLFYFRLEGLAKLVSYDTTGSIKKIVEVDTFQKTWDIIATPRMDTTYNLVFYSRKDGELKTVDARADGSFVAIDSHVLPAPDGSTPSASTFTPERHAWNNVVPMRAPLLSGVQDVIFVYHQVSGQGWFIAHLEDWSGWSWKVVNKVQMQRRWDEIAAGDFDADGLDDLAFYDQDTGLTKVLFLDADFETKSSVVLPSQGTAHGARLVAGHFASAPGLQREDLLLYQTDHGDTFEHGRLRVWSDLPAGTLAVDDPTQLDGWTHIVPVDLGGGVFSKGLLFYSNQHLIDVSYYVMKSTPSAAVSWNYLKQKTGRRHAAALRKTYAAAGLAFRMTLEPMTGESKEAASYDCNIKDNPDKPAVVAWVTKNVPDHVLPVLLASEGGGGTGCSGLTANFVREQYFYDHSADHAFVVEGHSAHEIGHYLGLAHGMVKPSKDEAKAGWLYDETFLQDKRLGQDGDIHTLDTDAHLKDKSQRVFDSPPTLTPRFWEVLGYDISSVAGNQEVYALRCPTTSSTPILTLHNGNGDTVEMVLYPPVISSYGMCPGTNGYGFGRLSRDQIQVVRDTLYTTRRALIE